MIPFLITLASATLLHFTEVLWQPPDSHDPDLSSLMCIGSVLGQLMHPTQMQQKSGDGEYRLLWTLLYMVQCLVLQYLALVFTWNALNSLCSSWAPGDSDTIFAYRLILATLLICFAVFRWRRRSHEAAEEALAAQYLELLEHEQMLPYRCNTGDAHMCHLCDNTQVLDPDFQDISRFIRRDKHGNLQPNVAVDSLDEVTYDYLLRVTNRNQTTTARSSQKATGRVPRHHKNRR